MPYAILPPPGDERDGDAIAPILAALLSDLPNGREWKLHQRKRWLEAFDAMLVYLYEEETPFETKIEKRRRRTRRRRGRRRGETERKESPGPAIPF